MNLKSQHQKILNWSMLDCMEKYDLNIYKNVSLTYMKS